jgi:hypothetical protein
VIEKAVVLSKSRIRNGTSKNSLSIFDISERKNVLIISEAGTGITTRVEYVKENLADWIEKIEQ